jgi:uncharacterized protein (DUF362 family)
MTSRRDFLRSVAAGGTAAALYPLKALSDPLRYAPSCFGLHPFIESHPDSVFIMRTHVERKTDGGAIRQAALNLGKSVFIPMEEGGIPVSHKVVVKPNITCRATWHSAYTVENSMGIVTDANFVEGVIEALKDIGLSGSQFYIREVNCPSDFQDGGYLDMVQRTGADLRDLNAPVNELSPENVQWVELPEGVWFRRIPFLWPVNAAETFLLNIAKFKAHSMGLTLCAKNLQGAIARHYQAHCAPYDVTMDISPDDIGPNAQSLIMESYNRHVAQNIPRWDRPGRYGGLWQEIWATRCLDNNAATPAGLHIIEGVYGRDGHFMDGPSPEGLATDYMSNIVIFGKNAFHVDIVGHWLGGHEPGNFGLFHMAVERGMASALNPHTIPVYKWKPDGSAVRVPLTSFERTTLKTNYLPRDYDGQSEPEWHLVDEPYNYGTTDVRPPESERPEAFVVRQNYPNPFNASTSIQFVIPHGGHVRLDVWNALGEVVAVLQDGFCVEGAHMAVWNGSGQASGHYFYRLRFEGSTLTGSMVMLR